MNVKKLVAGLATGTLLAGTALLATATAASAADEGPLLPGALYWFDQVGPVASQSPDHQIFSGTNGFLNRPYKTLAAENACPAGSLIAEPYIRIPQTGTPEDTWVQVSTGAGTTTTDAGGRFYTDNQDGADYLAKPEVMAYLQANGGAGTFPYIFVCKDGDGNSQGFFRTTIAMTGATDTALAWTIDSPAIADSRTASTTAITAFSASPLYNDGSPITVQVTGTGSLAGTAELFDGSTSLGTTTVDAAGVATFANTGISVGSHQLTVGYSGNAGNQPSTSAPVTVVVQATPATATSTTLAVDIVDGAPYQGVTLTATVAPVADGSIVFKDGSVTIATSPVASGSASITRNTFGAGAHSFTAEFVPADAALFLGSTSAATAATYVSTAVEDPQTVVVTIPVGAITITTPYTPANPLDLGQAILDPATATFHAKAPFGDGTTTAGPDGIAGNADDVYQGIKITDTRAGDLGFTASVVAGEFVNGASTFGGQYAGLTGLTVRDLTTDGLDESALVVTNNAPGTPGLATPQVFAKYAAGNPIGTAILTGDFEIAGVPSSVTPGLFTSTVTFSVI